MTADVETLTTRVHTALVQGTPDDNDIVSLIDIALRQNATIQQLVSDNERLKQAVVDAGDHISKLEAKIDSLSGLATAQHLVQYAEETTDYATDVQ